jgi:hypothetical protein
VFVDESAQLRKKRRQSLRFIENQRRARSELAQGELDVRGEDLKIGEPFEVEVTAALDQALGERGLAALPGTKQQHGRELPGQQAQVRAGFA